MSTTAINGRRLVQRVLAWLIGLLLGVLAFVLATSCATPAPSARAPRQARKFYHHRQRVHAQERRHQLSQN